MIKRNAWTSSTLILNTQRVNDYTRLSQSAIRLMNTGTIAAISSLDFTKTTLMVMVASRMADWASEGPHNYSLSADDKWALFVNRSQRNLFSTFSYSLLLQMNFI